MVESIISLINQDYPVNSFEIIVVDDNSNDRAVLFLNANTPAR